MGDSAGGNLAAVVRSWPATGAARAIALQVLIYPAVDHVNSYPSEDENAIAPMLGKADLKATRLYCPGHESEPYASPLFADHAGLAPALHPDRPARSAARPGCGLRRGVARRRSAPSS